MKAVVLAFLAAALAALLVPGVAGAKGPIEASVDGPGLEEPIVLSGREEPDALAPDAPLMLLAESLGFFPAAFGEASFDDGDPTTNDVNPMRSRRPEGTLGPRYVITYLVPGPDGVEDTLRQDVYPYARPGPVSYMPPGQPFFGWRETAGGWFVGRATAKHALVAAGLPAQPPALAAQNGDASSPWAAVAVVAGMVGLLAVGGTALLVRRRPRLAA